MRREGLIGGSMVDGRVDGCQLSATTERMVTELAHSSYLYGKSCQETLTN